MDTKQTNYQAYLIRLWLVDDDEQVTWRASLENAHTGERKGFASVQQLLAHLETQTEIIKSKVEIARHSL